MTFLFKLSLALLFNWITFDCGIYIWDSLLVLLLLLLLNWLDWLIIFILLLLSMIDFCCWCWIWLLIGAARICLIVLLLPDLLLTSIVLLDIGDKAKGDGFNAGLFIICSVLLLFKTGLVWLTCRLAVPFELLDEAELHTFKISEVSLDDDDDDDEDTIGCCSVGSLLIELVQ